MDGNEFEFDRKIDPSQLDVECVQQADLFFKWAERAVIARGEVETKKMKMDLVSASLQIKIREKPEDFGLAKVTEAAISAAVQTHQNVTDATKDYYDARQNSALLDKAVDAMEMKKRMLESLITLHGQQYFAGPSVPRNLTEVWKEHEGKAMVSVNKKQKELTRKRKD